MPEKPSSTQSISPSEGASSEQKHLTVNLVYDDKTTMLSAVLTPSTVNKNIDFQALKDLVVSSGFESFNLPGTAYDKVMRALRECDASIIELGEKPEYTDIKFEYDKSSRVLSIVFEKSDADPKISWASLQDIILKNNYQAYQIKGATLKAVIEQVQSNDRTPIAVGKKPEHTDYKFAYDEKTKTLNAVLSLSEEAIGYDLHTIQQIIDQGPYCDFIFKQDALTTLVEKIKSNSRGHIQLASKPEYTNIDFSYDEITRKLNANLTACDESTDISLESIRKKYQQGVFNSVILDDNCFEELLEKVSVNARGPFPIGEKPVYTELEFLYDDKTRKLDLVLTQTDQEHIHNLETLEKSIKSNDLEVFGISIRTLNEILSWTQQKKYGRFTISEKPMYTEITLIYSEESGVLKAELAEVDREVKNNKLFFQAQLRDEGYDNFYFEGDAIDNILSHLENHAHGTYHLAERRNALITIELDDLKMHAFITTTLAYGGKELTLDTLELEISQHAIEPQYYDKSVLESLLEKKISTNLLFASGIAAVNGENTKFEQLLEAYVYIRPEINIPGEVNINNIKEFVVVEAGTKIMQRIPPTLGENGCDVLGGVIHATPGDDNPFCKELVDVSVSPENENILVAGNRGHPIFLIDGVRIDQTLTVNDVDNKSGNIDFDGSVLVKGDVIAGMKVKASGNIVVKNMVTDAVLEAGTDIIVGGGIVGSDLKGSDGAGDFSTKIVAGYDISARYISLAKLSASNNVNVKEYVSHCHTSARASVLVGQNGGKGIIFGGECHGVVSVEANALGADSGLKTSIRVGELSSNKKNYDDSVALKEKRLFEAKQLIKVLVKLKPVVEKKPDNSELKNKELKIKNTVFAIKIEIDTLSTAIAQLKEIMNLKCDGYVHVVKKTYPNVTIHIGSEKFIIRQEGKGGRFVLEGSDLHWLAL
jgi:uncharacterized protein (DUF342 family)